MERRARYILIGLFVFATIIGGFGFVFWLHAVGGLGERSIYRIRFDNTVSGLREGAAVLFDGIRVGEVTRLQFNKENPRQIFVTISVARGTPVSADTQARVEVQGLMGSPLVSLRGGSESTPPLAPTGGEPPLLVAGASAGQDLTEAARQVLARIDRILADNADSLHDTISNIDTFSAVLSRNSNRVDSILAGLEKMTGGSSKAAPIPTFDLTAADVSLPPSGKPKKQLVVADPTTLVVNDTQRIRVTGSGGEISFLDDAQWPDSLPRLFQAKIIESFENAKIFSGVGRPTDGLTPDYQLLLDLREFQISVGPPAKAEIEFIAKILRDGRIIASRVFHTEVPVDEMKAPAVVAALDEAFRRSTSELVVWTAQKV